MTVIYYVWITIHVRLAHHVNLMVSLFRVLAHSVNMEDFATKVTTAHRIYTNCTNRRSES